ncbi:NAD dependent epimerase/dehydratase family protein [Mycobacteroides abscessus 21]|uniref:NAD dependent epimerase/dehydratase family protein n=1 Tax=Mycobacteroides abscessus 21 TaxID=1299324 RepID=A0A829PVZ1_9MYCO|nr:NAD dependent epimerase/dehydratase family protein [Mycobacteroides abscessus 21]
MSDLKPKVLVIGASGALGRAVCDVFSARHWNVLRGLRTPDGQPDSVYVDLEDEQSVAEAMAGVDIVVNTVPLNYTAERIALTTGAKLLSLAITEMSAQQGLRNQYLRASGTVVLNAGLAPGVTNLVVNDLVSHDRYWKGRITIAVPCHGMDIGAPKGFGWCTRTSPHQEDTELTRDPMMRWSFRSPSRSVTRSASVGPNETTAGCSGWPPDVWFVRTATSTTGGSTPGLCV